MITEKLNPEDLDSPRQELANGGPRMVVALLVRFDGKLGFVCVRIADRQSSYSLGCFGHKGAECRLTDSIIRPTSLNYTQTMTLDRSITYLTPQEPSQPMGTKTHSNQDHFPRLFIF